MNLFSKKQPTNQKSSLLTLIGHSIKKTGLWRDVNGGGIHVLAMIAIFCLLYTLLMLFIGAYTVPKDKLVEYFSVGSFTTMAVLKLNSLYHSRTRWRFLLSQVEYLEGRQLNNEDGAIDYESDNEDKKICFSNYIKRYTDRYMSVSVLLQRLYYSTLLIHMASPFVQYGVWMLQEQESEYPRMLPGWTPLYSAGIIGYVATILIELVACVYSVIVHITFDLLFVSQTIFICGQFLLLRDYSGYIGGSGNEYAISKERDDRAHFRIKRCHQFHTLLVKSIAEINVLITNILGVYFFVATLTLCSVAFRLVTEILSVTQLVYLLQYMCANLTQLFLYCYFGDAVLQGSSMGEGAFAAAYWCLSPRIRRELMILGVGTSKPKRLRAGPFNSLDLPSFIQVMRTAYSYYAMLRK